jgi:hypothetical protein
MLRSRGGGGRWLAEISPWSMPAAPSAPEREILVRDARLPDCGAVVLKQRFESF